jgi:hypothetical protein
MNPAMNITVTIIRNVSTDDDTATAREHSATTGLDSWTFPVCTNAKYNTIYHNNIIITMEVRVNHA